MQILLDDWRILLAEKTGECPGGQYLCWGESEQEETNGQCQRNGN